MNPEQQLAAAEEVSFDSHLTTALAAYEHKLLEVWRTMLSRQFMSMLEEICSKIMDEEDTFRPSLASSVFPEGARYYWEQEDKAIVLIEEKPTIRTVTFTKPRTGEMLASSERFRLAFPYVLFLMSYMKDRNAENNFQPVSISMFYRNAPLTSIHDQVFCVNLPNVLIRNGRVCKSKFKPPQSSNLALHAKEWLNYFWASEFTTDWDDGHVDFARKNKKFRSLKAWQEESRLDPLFVLKVDWGGDFNLHQVLANHWQIINTPTVSEIKAILHKIVSDAYIHMKTDDAMLAYMERHKETFLYSIRKKRSQS